MNRKVNLPDFVMVHWLVDGKEYLEYNDRTYLDDNSLSSFSRYGVKATATELFLSENRLTQYLTHGKIKTPVTIWVTKPTKDEEKVREEYLDALLEDTSIDAPEIPDPYGGIPETLL